MNDELIKQRKADHINICLNEDVDSNYDYWNDVSLRHNALPEINRSEISTKIDFFGKKLNHPIFIAAMSGGHNRSRILNENCAKVASELGIGFCIGSQRAAIENPDVIESYSVVKDYDIPVVLASIGGGQLIDQKGSKGFGVDKIHKAMNMIGANGLSIFLNLPQEAVQPEGDENTKGILKAIENLSQTFDISVKECGCGISRDVAMRLKAVGVKSIEVSGVSGTSWTAVECYRAEKAKDVYKQKLGNLLWDWGIPAPVSIIESRSVGFGIKIIGSGGINTGLDAARAIVLGADGVSLAKALLPYAIKSSESLSAKILEVSDELKTVMHLTGSKDIKALKKSGYVLTGKTNEWVKQRMSF
ncbi:MAG: type 2 isopentenyl-diphosphate Delta-isomerase [DPANN group archaeon]|nr:type 2 isopentenyl-diphosphate Delta-isomerase [DPANN group archaeon]